MSKYDVMQRATCDDGRIHGVLQYYGANRTGRWAGRLVQVQNLPKTNMKERQLSAIRDLVKRS
jgi:DNA polymerase